MLGLRNSFFRYLIYGGILFLFSCQKEISKEIPGNKPGDKPGDKPVPWWDGPKPPGRVQGSLKQVDCLPARQARLTIESDDRKIVKLLVADPGKVAYTGNGELTLGCGVQKPRRVIIEYFPKPNTRLATTGEVATIEFQ